MGRTPRKDRQEKFEETKEVIRCCTPKNERQKENNDTTG
jgi:hypothetical protein